MNLMLSRVDDVPPRFRVNLAIVLSAPMRVWATETVLASRSQPECLASFTDLERKTIVGMSMVNRTANPVPKRWRRCREWDRTSFRTNCNGHIDA